MDTIVMDTRVMDTRVMDTRVKDTIVTVMDTRVMDTIVIDTRVMDTRVIRYSFTAMLFGEIEARQVLSFALNTPPAKLVNVYTVSLKLGTLLLLLLFIEGL